MTDDGSTFIHCHLIVRVLRRRWPPSHHTIDPPISSLLPSLFLAYHDRCAAAMLSDLFTGTSLSTYFFRGIRTYQS